jgi:flagellar biosynthesis/type III secretory pathway protein FliH
MSRLTPQQQAWQTKYDEGYRDGYAKAKAEMKNKLDAMQPDVPQHVRSTPQTWKEMVSNVS